jgi:CheY-like chemotaxis protein
VPSPHHSEIEYRGPVEGATENRMTTTERAASLGLRMIEATPAEREAVAREAILARRRAEVALQLVDLDLPALDVVEALVSRLVASGLAHP